MGSRHNSNLVTDLCHGGQINTQQVERALRLVDRGLFVSPRQSTRAYTDSPYRSTDLHPGQIHVSAPSIYCSVLEFLDLHTGQSFLNIGSGSGYLSTVVGFILGENGHNHGVELYSNVVDHAQESVNMFFKKKFIAAYEWCRPEFVHGNAFLLKDVSKRYDRIYVGAQVDQSHVGHFSEMLKEGGIMVVPTKLEVLTRFQQIKRTSEGFETEDFMNVAFSELIHPNDEGYKHETPRGRKRKLEKNPTNPNESVTEDLLALFKPRSLEKIATSAIRKRLGETLRMTYPIAIVQNSVTNINSLDVIAYTIERHREVVRDRELLEQRLRNNQMLIHPELQMLGGLGHIFRMNIPPQIPMADEDEEDSDDDSIDDRRPHDFEGRDVLTMEARQEAEFNNQRRAARQSGNVWFDEDEEEQVVFDPNFMNQVRQEAQDQIAARNRYMNRDSISSSSSDSGNEAEGEGAEDDEGDSTSDESDRMDGFRAGIQHGRRFIGGNGLDDFIRRRQEVRNETEVYRRAGIYDNMRNILRAHRDHPIQRLFGRGNAPMDFDEDFLLDPNDRPLSIDDPAHPFYLERQRLRCLLCPHRSICRCFGVAPLKEAAQKVVDARLRITAPIRTIKKVPWMMRVNRINRVDTTVRSFDHEMPGVIREEMSPPLSNGRLSIEDWMLKRRQDEIQVKMDAFENAVREVGRLQYKQEAREFEMKHLVALSTCENVKNINIKTEKDSIHRFEKELRRLVDELPLPSNGKDALKWHLCRNS